MDIVLHFNNLKIPKCHSLFSAIFFDRPLSLQKTLPEVKVISPSVCADEKVHYNHNITITLFSIQVFQSFFFVMLSWSAASGVSWFVSLSSMGGAAYYLCVCRPGYGNMGGLMKKKLRYGYYNTF